MADLKIVVGEVLDALMPDGSPRFAGQNTVLNQLYAAMAAELSTAESPITVADTQYAGWDPRTMTWDGTHPTPVGETRIAQRMAWALRRPQIGVLHQDPRIPAYATWSPQVRPRVTVLRDRTLSIDWSAAAAPVGGLGVSRATFSWQRVGARTVGRTSWTARSTITTGALRRGSYVIRVQPGRGWMTGTWGPPVVVRVP